MAYEANNRHADCIALYQQLEKKHPSVSIRRQAAELRYILQAPKLKISQEEMVTIPLIGSSYDRYVSWPLTKCVVHHSFLPIDLLIFGVGYDSCLVFNLIKGFWKVAMHHTSLVEGTYADTLKKLPC